MEQMSLADFADINAVFKTADDYDFKDVEFMTAEEKRKVIRNFKKMIEKRDMGIMTERTYNHLHLHCGDIAHYNIHGYRATYEWPHGFKDFIKLFENMKNGYSNYLLHGDYGDINKAMVEIVEYHKEQIYKEIEEYEKKQEINTLKILAKKHGLRIEKLI